jgi:SanA protein
VPDSVIYLDYAGFRTFDSVIRCREIFGQNSITIISQRFHLERAIYISHYFGIGAIGYEAQDVKWSTGFRTKIRENFARVKVFLDIHTGEKPKFLGKKITIK